MFTNLIDCQNALKLVSIFLSLRIRKFWHCHDHVEKTVEFDLSLVHFFAQWLPFKKDNVRRFFVLKEPNTDRLYFIVSLRAIRAISHPQKKIVENGYA